MFVRPKKHLGQHFLKDKGTCEKIAQQLTNHQNCKNVVEVGPGMGALTEFLMTDKSLNLWLLEVDSESIDFLRNKYPEYRDRIIWGDFLKMNLQEVMGTEPFCVVGNFPYNISSQILFRCLEYRNQIPEIMGMFQKEVAIRIAEKPGTKEYGIISVFLQAFYDIHYCCTRNDRKELDCNEKLFFQVVKMAFNQRRKTLRNSIKQLLKGNELPEKFTNERPEQLSVDDFVELTLFIQSIS
jgi:16S rRNA (adenine1518-N6/adenine1519-N6)-dimethyltransferase